MDDVTLTVPSVTIPWEWIIGILYLAMGLVTGKLSYARLRHVRSRDTPIQYIRRLAFMRGALWPFVVVFILSGVLLFVCACLIEGPAETWRWFFGDGET